MAKVKKSKLIAVSPLFLTLFSASRKQLFFSFQKTITGFSPVFHRVFHGVFTEVHGCFRRGAEGGCFSGGAAPIFALHPRWPAAPTRPCWGSTVTVQLQELSHLGDHARIETLLPEQQAQSNTFATPLQKRMHTLDCESHVTFPHSLQHSFFVNCFGDYSLTRLSARILGFVFQGRCFFHPVALPDPPC